MVGADAHGDVDSLPRPLQREGRCAVLQLPLLLKRAGGEAFLLKSVVFQTRDVLFSLDDGLEDISIVVGVLALHHANETLESHTGIDDVHGELLQRAVSLAVELHEYEIPDFDNLWVVLIDEFTTSLATSGLLLWRARVDVNL